MNEKKMGLVVTHPSGERREYGIEREELTIGRVPGNDVVLPRTNVSKRHARIVRQDDRYFIVDLKSLNGTYLRGRRIETPIALTPGTTIQIGEFVLLFGPIQEQVTPPVPWNDAVDGDIYEVEFPPVAVEIIGPEHFVKGQLATELLSPIFAPVLGEVSTWAGTSPREGMRGVWDTSPLVFPGGDLGSLAVYGALAELAAGGGRTSEVVLSFSLGAGVSVQELHRVLRGAMVAARRCGVRLLGGDVTQLETPGKIVVTTTAREQLGASLFSRVMTPTGTLLLTGPVAAHGAALHSVVQGSDAVVWSDLLPVHELPLELVANKVTVHWASWLGRGGVVDVLRASSILPSGAMAELPVEPAVQKYLRSAGVSAEHMASAGAMLLLVSRLQAKEALAILQKLPAGKHARILGDC